MRRLHLTVALLAYWLAGVLYYCAGRLFAAGSRAHNRAKENQERD